MEYASKEAQIAQAELIDDTPFPVRIGSHTFKARYLKSFNQRKISLAIAKQLPNPSGDVEELILLMAAKGKLTPQCISRLILSSYWKIKLFHWVFWRWLDYTYDGRHFLGALSVLFKAYGFGFFFQNMVLLTEMNILTKRLTKTELKQLSAELQSEKKLVL